MMETRLVRAARELDGKMQAAGRLDGCWRVDVKAG
jgi:hypothetical protein